MLFQLVAVIIKRTDQPRRAGIKDRRLLQFDAAAGRREKKIFKPAEAGGRAVDGVFAVTFDCARNAERFSRAANWVNFGFLGVFASAASFALWNYACRSLGVVRASVGLYLTPVIGVAFAVAFLGEALTASGVCGGALILAGVYVASRTGQKERQ